MDLNGKVVIVTGSASGIGAAAARQLAAAGARVTVNYTRSEDGAKATVAAVEAAGSEALLCRAGVSDDADCRRMADATMERFGRIDGLLNNAGTTKFVDHANLDGLELADFQRIFAVNLVGPFQMSRAVAAHMRAGGGGGIVNVSSIAGVMGVGSSIAYAASKGALNTMTLSLARVLGPQIRVNAVCPGFVQGDWLREGMGHERYDRTKRHLEETTPLRRAGQADDMAGTAIWLMFGNPNITGEVLICDAGMHLGGAPLKAR